MPRRHERGNKERAGLGHQPLECHILVPPGSPDVVGGGGTLSCGSLSFNMHS